MFFYWQCIVFWGENIHSQVWLQRRPVTETRYSSENKCSSNSMREPEHDRLKKDLYAGTHASVQLGSFRFAVNSLYEHFCLQKKGACLIGADALS